MDKKIVHINDHRCALNMEMEMFKTFNCYKRAGLDSRVDFIATAFSVKAED